MDEKDFFISYSHKDSDYADALSSALTTENKTYFLDKADLHGGDDWAAKLTEGIENSKVFSVLCSPDSIISYQVMSEVVIARNRRKVIIPVKIRPFDFANSKGMEYHLSPYEMVTSCNGFTKESLKEILYLFETGEDHLTNEERMEFYPPNNANIKGPVIYTTQELLDRNYSKRYISMKHIELDYITVNPAKYDIVDEIEGTMDTWMDMIGLTAESSAQLVHNNQIVGYLDFIPVPKDIYEELITNKRYFTEDLAADTTFGGEFNVYGSMFSLDSNYSTPQNIILFIEWIINRLKSWKEEDLIIEKMTFSIYMDSQAKILKSLGFKEIFKDRIKGMLLETSVEDFLNNEIVINKVINKKVKYASHSKHEIEIVNECNSIAETHHERHGGYLHFENLVGDCDHIICAEENGKVVGYIALKEYQCLKDALYIEQIAILKEYQRRRIASFLVMKAIALAKDLQLSNIIANVRSVNRPSLSFFNKLKFTRFDMSREDFLSVGFEESDISNNLSFIFNINS